MLICKDLSEDCILGLDFLINSPSTKDCLSSLANCIINKSEVDEITGNEDVTSSGNSPKEGRQDWNQSMEQ